MNLKRLRGLNEHRLKRYRERLVARMKAATAKPNAPDGSDLLEEGPTVDQMMEVASDMHVCASSPMQTRANSSTNHASTNAFPILPGEVPSSSQDEGGSYTHHFAENAEEEGFSTVLGAGNGNESLVSMSSILVNDIVEPEQETAATYKETKGHSPGSSNTRVTVKPEPRTTRSREAAAGREATEAATESRRPKPLSVP